MNPGTLHAIIADMNCSGIILSGGRGRRVGGADKGLLKLDDKTQLEQVLARLAPQLDDITISANRNLDSYRAMGLPVVTDTLDDFQGPLAGILSALPHCKHEVAVVVPCDTPELPQDLVLRLLQALEDPGIELSYAHDGKRGHYLCAALRTGLAASLTEYLAGEERSVRGWYEKHRVAIVDFSDRPAAFINLNQGTDGQA